MVWDIDREIISFGALALRWYSLLFALGIVFGYFIMQSIFKKEGKPLQLLDSLLFHIVIGTVVGARLGHCLFYEPMDYLTNPLRILKVWEGGLASHGGILGVLIALLLFCRRHREISFFWLADRMSIPTMVACGMIRIGNLFNSEIIGRPTDVPWAVIFKKIDDIPRHPSQIYEAIGYFSIALIQYGFYRMAGRKPPEGRLAGSVMIIAFSFRLAIEYFKENQVAFEDALVFNMGQFLSMPFILFGIFLVAGGHHKVAWLRLGLSPEARGPDAPVIQAEDAEPATAVKSRRGQLRKQRKKVKG